MRKAASALCTLGLLAVTAGCIQHEGQLAIFLTNDSVTTGTNTAIGAQQVNVEITEVAIRDSDSGEFITLSFGSQVYELLSLQNRTSLVALADSLDEGIYTMVRIRFSEANSSVVNAAGRKTPLSIEPGTITVPVSFPVVEETQTSVTLGIDVIASVSQKANGSWVFRPVVRQSVDSR